ncbi:alpha/beta hydrolase family protein [Cyclobacterium xiamenense]|uniref:alpha/beta hydrolase family protein n=1 Tax=Cyclobacterium xiamenense TaxID=1297121 RepID=UPI0035CF0490
MNKKICFPKIVLLSSGLLMGALAGIAQNTALIDPEVETARTNAYEKQLENYLRHFLVDEYEARAASRWNRDYSSPAALERSVEPNRRRWEEVLSPPILSKSGPLETKPYPLGALQAEWLTLPLGLLTAEAVLAFPEGASKQQPVPLIIVQHGIGSSPETPFTAGAYHEYAKGLLDAGFAVLIPMNLRSVERRNNVERYARLAGTSLPGIELVRVQHLLDGVLADPRVDEARVGMWGVSLGGMATLFWMPLESRIKAGVVSAWFNERRNKMAVPDPRYSSFSPREEHAFFNGWLTEFSDEDLVSLIVPRPLMIQHGKKDNIAHWPQVVEAYEKAALHYQRLDIPEKVDLVLHEGGHEAIVAEGVKFLTDWLAASNRENE